MNLPASTPTVHRRACNLCEAICGLLITVDGDGIQSIKGDPDDPLSRGHICPKAVALQDLQSDPDRVRSPMRRRRDVGDGTEWEPIAWDEALDLVATELVRVRREHGDDALAVYLGNPSVHNYGILTHQGALFTHLKTRNRYTATSVDQLPQHLVSLWLYGHKDLLPVPDIDRMDYLLMLGANPIASNGSIWTVPDVRKRIRAMQQRGGRLVVIDPRLTETAAIADAHHAIQPGTDALLLAAVLRELLEHVDLRTLAVGALVDGLDTVRAALDAFSPAAVATTTGIDADTIRGIARDLRTTPRAACYGRMGVTTQAFGTLNHWLIQLVNIVAGNLDTEGGTLFTHPAAYDPAKTRPGHFNRYQSRVSGQPEFSGDLPSAVLAEEILTPGAGQVRALFTCAGNPVLSTPNGRQLDEALASLDFMVSLDPFINETTRHADVILPPTSPLEHDHYDIAFHPLAIRNTARFNEAVFAPPEGALHDWEIFAALGERVAELLEVETREQIPPAAIIDDQLQRGTYSNHAGHPAALSLAKLREHPSGIDLGPLQPSLPERLVTANGRIDCATAECLADLARAQALMDSEPSLTLIGRRHIRSNNSWMHNSHRLVKGRDRCTLLMHPDDMCERGLDDGDTVRIASRVGAGECTVERDAGLRPGVVSLPHGYGHDRTGVKLAVAGTLNGLSYNDLTDHTALDPVSGNAALNGVPVTVAPAH